MLARATAGDVGARDVVFERSFGRLRRIAASLLSRERGSITLQATVLVNEAFVNRLHNLSLAPESSEHFFSLCARAMRQVLIDRGRLRRAIKNTPIDDAEIGRDSMRPPKDLGFSAKVELDRLGQFDSQAADTIRLRYLDGFTVGEIADLQSRDRWRVSADCEYGMAWLRKQLR